MNNITENKETAKPQAADLRQIGNTNYISIVGKKTQNRKPGECFYFTFKNGDSFLGIVLYAGLDWGVWYEKKSVILVFKNKLIESEITNIDYINGIIGSYENLAMPPKIVDNSGWNYGFYKSFAQVDINQSVRYSNGITFYNDAFERVENMSKETVRTNNLYLCGIQTIANCYGIETLMEISMDYEFVEKPKERFNPYYYISEVATKNHLDLQIPFWYYKAKERLNK